MAEKITILKDEWQKFNEQKEETQIARYYAMLKNLLPWPPVAIKRPPNPFVIGFTNAAYNGVVHSGGYWCK